MTTKANRMLASAVLATFAGALCASGASATTMNLVHEFDGNADGLTSFGTVDLVQDGLFVDVTITANTANLMGGDIHEFYFNLPGTLSDTLALSDSGGVSDETIGAFSLDIPPSVAGGAGASFEVGVSFGNGASANGNGTLTTATFSLTASGGLLVDDLLTELSDPNNTPDVYMAVHFQGTDIFGADSETVGGVPEPGSLALLGLGGLALLRRWR